VAALFERPLEVDAALERFGRRASASGWTLGDAAEWIDLLARLAMAESVALRRFDAGIALAQGWTTGFVHSLHERSVTDANTGLPTLAVLAVRLRQVYDQCASLGVRTETAFTLLIADVDLSAFPPLLREAIQLLVAERVRETFNSGETVCMAGGTVVVLVSRTPDLPGRVAMLEASLRTVSLLEDAPLVIWLEDLPTSPERIDHLLLDVAGG
jgi:GGDEF domain-containing protein